MKITFNSNSRTNYILGLIPYRIMNLVAKNNFLYFIHLYRNMYPAPEIININEAKPIANNIRNIPELPIFVFVSFKNKKIEPVLSPTPIMIKTIPNSFDLKFNILVVILY